MLDAMVLGEEIAKHKTGDQKMKNQDKIAYMKEWKAANINILIASGLDLVTQGPNKPSFVTCLLFSLSTARSIVPHLQQVSHFDACHTMRYPLVDIASATSQLSTI